MSDEQAGRIVDAPPHAVTSSYDTATPHTHGHAPTPSKTRSKKAIAGEKRRKRTFRERQRERQLTALLTAGLQGMSDVKWEETKNAILFGMAQTPGPNAQNQLKAIELIDRRRQEQKFGSREAVEATKARCERRLGELRELERWAQHNGVVPPRAPVMGHPTAGSPVVGQPGAQEGAGETPTGQEGTLEKTGVA